MLWDLYKNYGIPWKVLFLLQMMRLILQLKIWYNREYFWLEKLKTLSSVIDSLVGWLVPWKVPVGENQGKDQR